MKRNKYLFWLSAIISSLLFVSTAYGHSRYILPSHTLLSGEEKQAVTLITSISNDIFHPDMPFGDDGTGVVPKPMQALFKQLQASAIQPGNKTIPINLKAFSRFSAADLLMEDTGTYKVSISQPSLLMTTFEDAEGNAGRVFGNQALPEDITEVVKRQLHTQVETYVTLNKPSRDSLDIKGKGLELVFDTHPNDLFVNEKGRYQLLFDGKGIEGASAHITLAGTRHRNARNTSEIKTGKDGFFDLSFDEAGFYLIELAHSFSGDTDIDMVHHTLFITLEVFAE